MFDPEPPAKTALDDYLLKSDFVLSGEIGVSYDGATVQIPVLVDSVHLGAIPHRTIVLINLFPHPPMRPHMKVLAWGTWDGAKGDTCFGSALPVSDTGGLWDKSFRTSLVLDSVSVAAPGSLDRLLQKLAQRESEHPAAWLTQGTSIGMVEVTAVSENRSFLQVAPLRTLVGTSHHWPKWLRLSALYSCRYVPTPKDTLLVTTTGDDTLLCPVCMHRLRLSPGSPTLVGTAPAELERVYVRGAHALSLRRIYDEERH